MKLFSHAHINGNGSVNTPMNAEIIGSICKEKGYDYTVLGCHEGFIASSVLCRKIENKFGVKIIRFAELSLKARGVTKYANSHVGILNIPEQPIEGFSYGCAIENIVPYAKKVGAKLILHHPESLEEIDAFASFIDGFELINGLDNEHGLRDVSFRNEALSKYPHLTVFKGADLHTWEGTYPRYRGNLDYFTELPDNYFGSIYA